jgi:nitrite reductase/ring-hydroxylating ferredoxin subunit
MSAERATSGTDLTRRGVMRGAAVGGLALPLLAACGGDGGGTGAPEAAGSGSAVPSVSAAVAAIPVGGGKIFADQLVVVTQPTKGEFKAFTATCTHQGCPVTAIQDGQIICPCHASHYSIEDGSVLSGPAPKPLAEYPVAVEGDQVVVG